jgi:uncharacterized damage-inducible protein DinB
VKDQRYSLTPESSERELLTTFLEFQRGALVRKCEGLSDEQMCRRAIPTSNLTLVGIVRHLATVERWYFQSVIAGGSPRALYDHQSDEAFNAVDGASREESFRIWSDEIALSRQIAAGHDLDAVSAIPTDGLVVTLRWVLVHMIDEYARHLGHADMVREAIDGVTGE